MSHLLYFWRGDNYLRDLDFGVGFNLNQTSPTMHRIDVGESLWALSRSRDGVYVLAAELIAKTKTLNPRGYRYGRYRVWGDLTHSRYFAADAQPDVTTLVRSLSITARGDALGRAFQGNAAVREITDGDHRVLAAYATRLPPEPRARLIPEEQLEALLLAGDESAVSRLMHLEGNGLADQRKEYLVTRAVRRDANLVRELRETYGGACQITAWNPRELYGVDLCEGHHIRWLSRGGADDLHNMVLIAPNVHRAIHRLDAQFDWDRLAFVTARGALFEVQCEHTIRAE
jgi:5-methylcytosine-specific restriction enzyme A